MESCRCPAAHASSLKIELARMTTYAQAMHRSNDIVLASALLVALAITTAAPASACSVPFQARTPAQVRADARDRFAAASLVVDAEVLVPMTFGSEEGQMPVAVLRVEKVLKGGEIPGNRVAVVYATSCDLTFSRKGEMVRVLLADGPTTYRADSTDHGPATSRKDAQAEFNREIDGLSGSLRPIGYSAFPGAEEPPSPTNAEQSAYETTVSQSADRGAERNHASTMLSIVALVLAPIGLIYSAIGMTRGVTGRRWLLLGLCALCGIQSLISIIYFGNILLPVPQP